MNSLHPEEFVTVPRSALQALAEWAYIIFCRDRIWAKLPPKHPRWGSHRLDDDIYFSLQKDRMAFLKDLFWRAEQEASRRERAADPTRGFGETPSLERFMECVAEMDDPHWDEPLPPKNLAERKKLIKAEKAEIVKWENRLKHPSPETIIGAMTNLGDTSLFTIKKNLASESPEIRTKAYAEIPRLMAGLRALSEGLEEAQCS